MILAKMTWNKEIRRKCEVVDISEKIMEARFRWHMDMYYEEMAEIWNVCSRLRVKSHLSHRVSTVLRLLYSILPTDCFTCPINKRQH